MRGKGQWEDTGILFCAGFIVKYVAPDSTKLDLNTS